MLLESKRKATAKIMHKTLHIFTIDKTEICRYVYYKRDA